MTFIVLFKKKQNFTFWVGGKITTTITKKNKNLLSLKHFSLWTCVCVLQRLIPRLLVHAWLYACGVTRPQIAHYVGDPPPAAHAGVTVEQLCWDDGMDWGEDKMSRHEVAQLDEASETTCRWTWLTWLVVTVRAMTVCRVHSQVQRQEGGVVQGPVGGGRQGCLSGPLCEEGQTWRHGN